MRMKYDKHQDSDLERTMRL